MLLWILVLLVVLILAAGPVWPYSRDWGPYPSGIGAVLLVLVLFFWLLRGHL